MMREAFRKRLEAVEESRRLRHCAATQIIHIHFPGLDPDYAEGPGDFICYRHPGEELEVFENRCCAELLAHNPRPRIPPILLYRNNLMKSVA
jgi:hypothetical protein